MFHVRTVRLRGGFKVSTEVGVDAGNGEDLQADEFSNIFEVVGFCCTGVVGGIAPTELVGLSELLSLTELKIIWD